MNSDAMIAALQATGPDPHLQEHLMLFGQFVGSWDVDITNIASNGTVAELKGEWHFGWVLQGRAVMDVWIAPCRSMQGSKEPYEYGATIRFYDTNINAWRSTWIGPVRNLVRPFIAREMNGEIVLEGSFALGSLTRWIFSEIRADSFQWRNMESVDDGQTWKTVQRMSGRRKVEIEK